MTAADPSTARVVVWIRSVAAARHQRAALTELLVPDELQRMSRFHRDADALRFLVGRSTLRREVGACLAIPPRDVAVAFGPQGKPLIPGGPHVNVAHSGDVVIVALCADAPIGVDVEEMLPAHVDDATISLSFSAAEIRALSALPERDRIAAFFQIWTTKEALLKAAATGLSISLQSFDVAVDPASSPALVAARCDELAGTISVARIDVPVGYAAAVAAFAPAVTVEYR